MKRGALAAAVALGALGAVWALVTGLAGTNVPPPGSAPREARADVTEEVGRETEARDPARMRGDAPAEARASSAARPEPALVRPHPMTPLHEAMSRRREVIAALTLALEDKNYERARGLLGEADELEKSAPPSDGFGETVRGYRLILDCLSARSSGGELSSELEEASARYVREQRMSPRRQVRRVCLEGRLFARRA